MQTLFQRQKVFLEELEKQPFYDRHIYRGISFDSKIMVGIVGARGVGKTTLLLKHALESGAKQERALYVTADDPYFLKNNLLDLAERLCNETNVTLLCVDEIHKCDHWNQMLKNIYDLYHKRLHVVFSGSSCIDIIRSKYDLSRRVLLFPLYGFSFREYLEFYQGLKLPTLTLKQILQDHSRLVLKLEVPQILMHFKNYLKFGYYLYLRLVKSDIEKSELINNVILKAIYEDISIFHNLKTPTLLLIEKLFRFIVLSSPGEINAHKLSKIMGKDYESVVSYIAYLEEAGLVKSLCSEPKAKLVLKKAEKLYPDNTNFIYPNFLTGSDESIIGKVRETFFLNQLENAGHKLYYSKQGDFTDGNHIFEIGGKNKTRKQVINEKYGYVFADGITVGLKNRIPLYLAGFLY